MNVFSVLGDIIQDYAKYVEGFIRIHDPRIQAKVREEMEQGLLWPESLLGLNPNFQSGGSVDDLVSRGLLYPECSRILQIGKGEGGAGRPIRFHQHQVDAVEASQTGENYVLTTGTGSGKSLAYIVPIVDHVLRVGSGKGIQVIVIYPMNALANSQMGELEKFLCEGYPDRKGPVTFRRYTGQEKDAERQEIIANPPDILLTNYVTPALTEGVPVRLREKGTSRCAVSGECS